MSEAQEEELVAIVERLTVEVQIMASRCWEALGTAESARITREVGELNVRLCNAFPFLKDSPGDAAVQA